MGVFDTIIVSGDVLNNRNIRCPECYKLLPKTFQTKCLDAALDEYILKNANSNHDENNSILSVEKIKLYLLDAPDEKYWKEYSSEEIEGFNNKSPSSAWNKFFHKKPGDGYFRKEAFFPENRRHCDMGELPHMILKMYSSCECGKFVNVDVKFTDGLVVDIKTSIPQWSKINTKDIICNEEDSE